MNFSWIVQSLIFANDPYSVYQLLSLQEYLLFKKPHITYDKSVCLTLFIIGFHINSFLIVTEWKLERDRECEIPYTKYDI